MKKIEIGVIVKPHGIKGEVRIKEFIDDFSSVKDLKRVYVDDIEYNLKNIRNSEQGIIVELLGIADRNTAELLRGKTVYADKDKIKKQTSAYFITDLINIDVYLSSGKKIGVVTDVRKSNVDIFEMQTEEGVAYFPFLKDLVEEVNLAENKLILNAKRFTEVVCYEG